MWNPDKCRDFEACVAELLDQPEVQRMDEVRQHVDGVSCLDHCIFVAYLSFSICRRLGLDYRSAARGALLHDMHLCDWTHDPNSWKRLFIHPKLALQNAEAFGLNDLERDIIAKHMWPVTLRKFPRHLESAVVNLADKICATAELLHLYKLLKAGEKLLPLNKRKALSAG